MGDIKNYDEEPVWYCATCLSLNILNSSGAEDDLDDDPLPCHCGDCNSTDIVESGPSGIYEVLELQLKRKQHKK